MPSKYRIAATLEPEVYQWIIDKATQDGRTPSNLLAFLVTRAVKEEMEGEQKNSRSA